ncbi:DUF2271 domain-containing protein [Niveibacterium sp. SC-1]|uniref:DUF2271 domain-containing protein n=1 Tax=Niveibacterium sp. SC-1 TaxID=3135646 RepID=UPI00311E5996
MQLRYSFALGAMLGSPAMAADAVLKLEIPRLDVAEYHRPYVAVWLERAGDQSHAANLAVWYDLKLKNKEGTKWLKDMRQWWRKSGRELDMPVDGLSGATRAPGVQQLAFAGDKAPFDKLPAGDYELVVEAAREVGGRELLRVPFQWPPKSAQSLKAKGEHELGAIALDIKP